MKLIPDWAAQRRNMVEKQLRSRQIRDKRVLHAMQTIPREYFVPPRYRNAAYTDQPIDIGYGQTISQPYMTALMAETLELDGSDSVLEVGAGCGYAAAVMGSIAKRVVSLEIVPELAAIARDNLHYVGRDGNITIIGGDGSMGYASRAPYDAISVAAGAPHVPESLIDQLNTPGTLVIPVGDRGDQELRILHKTRDGLLWNVVTQCRFVPLRGGEGWD